MQAVFRALTAGGRAALTLGWFALKFSIKGGSAVRRCTVRHREGSQPMRLLIITDGARPFPQRILWERLLGPAWPPLWESLHNVMRLTCAE